MPLFNQHHYNVLAKEIREIWQIELPTDSDFVQHLVRGNNTALSQLVLSLSLRFAADNPAFIPMRFVEAAIPSPARENLIKQAMGG